MCPQEVAQLNVPRHSARTAELVDLRRTAARLHDLASYLSNHQLEHEAAYVMMALDRVRAKCVRVAV